MTNEKSITRRCNNCVFQGTFRDMGSSCGVCTLEDDLVKAISRYDENVKTGCDDFFTKEMIPLLKSENEELRVTNEMLRNLITSIAHVELCKKCYYKVKKAVNRCI